MKIFFYEKPEVTKCQPQALFIKTASNTATLVYGKVYLFIYKIIKEVTKSHDIASDCTAPAEILLGQTRRDDDDHCKRHCKPNV